MYYGSLGLYLQSVRNNLCGSPSFWGISIRYYPSVLTTFSFHFQLLPFLSILLERSYQCVLLIQWVMGNGLYEWDLMPLTSHRGFQQHWIDHSNFGLWTSTSKFTIVQIVSSVLQNVHSHSDTSVRKLSRTI